MEYTTPRVNPNVNCGLWLLEMRHSRFISFYKCATLVGMLIIWEAVHGGSGFMENIYQFSLLSRVWLFETPLTAVCQTSLSITNSQSRPKPIYIESVIPSSHRILCRPLLLLPSIPPSIRVFSNESTLHIRWPKYWSFSFSISPSNEHPGLISFRMDWLDLVAVQQTLKSLLQITVQKHQFFGAQLSSQSNSHIHTWPLEKPYLWLDRPLLTK